VFRLVPLSALLLTTACASITTGTTQSVAVDTNPPGASCVISREGTQIARVPVTPGTVTVDKSSRALEVRCTREGHGDGVAVVPSSVQAMTAGNLLAGGLIGVAVDASSGAMHHYPQAVSVTLPAAPAPSSPRT
jgi:hypothetical protein